jgi:hypothetical protein
VKSAKHLLRISWAEIPLSSRKEVKALLGPQTDFLELEALELEAARHVPPEEIKKEVFSTVEAVSLIRPGVFKVVSVTSSKVAGKESGRGIRKKF